eukprot:TRINITY_DN1334_c0_g2_i1.p1 TRINITY_DN1334_c0_g2~~TRINITY_DN1334_c0_g2_i1.p1  ORF type:complete len:114 (-),score=3.19 TRINITY_DN1334_c0_g2_i1:170-511(-)
MKNHLFKINFIDYIIKIIILILGWSSFAEKMENNGKEMQCHNHSIPYSSESLMIYFKLNTNQGILYTEFYNLDGTEIYFKDSMVNIPFPSHVFGYSNQIQNSAELLTFSQVVF